VSYQKRQSTGEQPSSGADYCIDHFGYIYVVRPDGQTGDVLSPSATPKDIVEVIKPWLGWARGPYIKSRQAPFLLAPNTAPIPAGRHDRKAVVLPDRAAA
jgi:hypothetical protein